MAIKPIHNSDSAFQRVPPDIFHAAEFNDVAELLEALAEGQRLDARLSSRLDMTPLHIACIRSSNDFLLAALQQPTLDVWAKDNNLRVAFDHASARNNKPIMRALLEKMYPDSPHRKTNPN